MKENYTKYISNKADRVMAFPNEFPQFIALSIAAAREVQEKTGDMALDRLVPYLEGIQGIISPEVDRVLETVINNKNLNKQKVM